MKNTSTAILGAASGYHPELVEPFVSSLVKIHYEGNIVLFINADQVHLYTTYFQKYHHLVNIKLVPVIIGAFKNKQKVSKIYRSIIKRVASILAVDFFPHLKSKFLHLTSYPHVARFFEYRNYLIEHSVYSHVLLTDVRDVVFQADPFEGLAQGIHIGMENRNVTISQDKYNKSWILDAYGSSSYENLKNKHISCSGVTIGDYDSLLQYINQMIVEFMKQPYTKMSDRIYDQAMHNKLVHFNEIPDIHVCYPLESRIATLGLMPYEDFKFNQQGQLLNIDSTIVAIVHQYDRHPTLKDNFL